MRTYSDAVEALNSLQANFATLEAIRKTGGRSNSLSIPQMIEWSRRIGYEPKEFDKLNVVHVTGTKGKGSTCAFVQSILGQYKNEGLQKIGLYTSPHLKSVRERIRINGDPIDENKFAKYFFQVWDTLDKTTSDITKFPDMGPGEKPGYFRFLTLLSFHAFVQEGVDTAIYEVGIGGEYDSTNIVVHPSVTGVSSLGIDHVQVLGDTIEKIAWNKGGIYKPGAPSLTVVQPEGALKVLEDRANEKGNELEIVPIHPQIKNIELGLKGEFQRINASLAVKLAALHLKNMKIADYPDINEKLPPQFVTGLEKAQWPGRCQTIQDGNIRWLLDGAHTPESIIEAGKWFNSVSKGKDVPRVLFFNQQSRDANALVGSLHSVIAEQDLHFDLAVFSTNKTWAEGFSSDLVSHNISADAVKELVVQKSLAGAWKKLEPNCSAHVFASIEEATKFIREKYGDQPVDVLVTGSILLLGGFLTVLDGR